MDCDVIELGPDDATIFYWVLTACSTGFVAISGLLAYHRIAFRQRLALGSAALIVPASRWSRAEKEIAYRDISGLSEEMIHGERFLRIMHTVGQYTITASMLPSKAVFAEVCGLLAERAREVHAAEQGPTEPSADSQLHRRDRRRAEHDSCDW